MAQTDNGVSRKTVKPRRRIFGVFAALAVVTLAILAFVLTREHPLTERAARISNIADYCWINDQELLWFTPELSRASRIHLQTHKQDYLENFNDYVNTFRDKSGKSAVGPISHASISPNGKRLLCQLKTGQTDYYTEELRTCIVDLDDGHLHVFRNPERYNRGDPVWMPDSRRWLEYTSEQVYSGPVSSDLSLYSLDAPERKVGPLPIPPGMRSLLGVSPDYRMIGCSLPPGVDQPMLGLFEVGLYPNPLKERKCTQNAPAGWFFRDAVLSPQGDRVVCLLTTARQSELLAFFARIAPSRVKLGKPSRLFQIRICRTDGRQIQEVGVEDTGPDGTAAVNNLQWSPDGKKLSFVLKGSLYIVPLK